MPTINEIVEMLEDKISDANRNYHESQDVAPGSYGHGYDYGAYMAFKEALDIVRDEVEE